MRSVRSTDTAPEITLRKALWAKGLRYRVNVKSLPGKPDLVFPTKRIAVFVDGDFWHGGQWSKRKLTSLEDQFISTQSQPYWLSKIKRNMRRDCSVTNQLISDKWTVLRFWESEVKKDLEGCVKMITEEMQNRTEAGSYALLPQKTFAEFFAGIGLVRMGLENKGWSISFANDIDPQKYDMYSAHFGDDEPQFNLGDIHELSVENVPTVTLATASFPCNDLSLAGARNGLKGKWSSAFWGFVQILDLMDKRRPPLILLENVSGFLSSEKGADITKALLALNNLGYNVDIFQLNANHFVPQSRPRLFIVGQQNSSPTQPELGQLLLIAQQKEIRSQKITTYIQAHPEIKWNIRNLPTPPECPLKLEDVLEDLPHDATEWWSRERVTYLLNQMSERHRAIADQMIAKPAWSYGTVFRRVRNGKSMGELRTDGIAGCLRTPLGGSGRQILFKAGFGESLARLLTPRECARLMGASDYKIDAPLNQALYGFGDAVCVPVIEWISEHYLEPLINELLRRNPLRLEHEVSSRASRG